MEGTTEHGDEEVDGVAPFVGVDPTPVVVFDDEAGEVGQFEVARCPDSQAQHNNTENRYAANALQMRLLQHHTRYTLNVI